MTTRHRKFTIKVPVNQGMSVTRLANPQNPNIVFQTSAWDIEVTGTGSAQIEGRVRGHNEFRIIDTLANEGSIWHRAAVNAFRVTATGGDILVTFSSRGS